ncbi:MAG: hypothetical protein O7B23_08585 [Deltaproteobacteria bacterium]|nr:hypothetical protein [Deltaproteobacteria bacterium]
MQRLGSLTWCIALALLGSAGCTAHQYYSGERRPKDEVARITIRGLGWFIKAVDGHERQAQSAEVLPGSHTIKVARQKMHWVSGWIGDLLDPYEFLTVTIYAEAGHTYRLELADDPPRRMVVTDITEDK